MSLRAAPPPPASDPAAVALDALAAALAPRVAALLSPRDELVDVAREVPASKRVLYSLCRRGEIGGAVRVGRRWLAPRASVDAWLRARGPRVVAPVEGEADVERALRRLGASR